MKDTKEKPKMNQYKILALIGEAGTGKDTLMREVLKQDPSLHEIISCTTRPPR
jgi:guanylate kinase